MREFSSSRTRGILPASSFPRWCKNTFLIHFLYMGLVSGLDPLEVSISREGMARFCTMPYEVPNCKNLHKTFMHLANYSLNKRSKDFIHSEEGKEGVASKQTLTSVLKELECQGIDTEGVWEVEEMVGKTMVAVLPQLMVERKAFLVEHSLQNPPAGFQVCQCLKNYCTKSLNLQQKMI